MPHEFYIVTVYEPSKFAKVTRKILQDAKKYGFHFEDLLLFFSLITVETLKDVDAANKHYIVFNQMGWTIILQMPTFVEVKYIFVYPEHRRTGFFTDLLSLLKRQNKDIIVCTKESIMLRALIAKGFQLKGRSRCETELFYLLPKQ